MAVAVLGDNAWIFGGRDIEGSLSELLILDLVTFTWMTSTASGPVGRIGHCMVGLDDSMLFLYGGAGQYSVLGDQQRQD